MKGSLILPALFQLSWGANVSPREAPYMTTIEMLEYWGYPGETITVQTEDGYLLSLDHIPAKENNSPVVFLAHGLLMSSTTWTFGPPEKSLGMVLHDAGYDVWMGNTRGNTYSKQHISLDNCFRCEEFWDFDWDETGRYDYKAEIDEVLSQTGADDLYLIGHSMGGSQTMVFLSTFPEYNAKMRAVVLLAPAVFMNHADAGIFSLAENASLIADNYHENYGYSFFPHTAINEFIAHTICNEENPAWFERCLDNALIGMMNEAQTNLTMLPQYLDHLPEGSSVRPFVHYSQSYLSGLFCNYDFEEENNAHYGSDTPPEYDLSLVTAPVALLSGDGDVLVDPVDVAHLFDVLPNGIFNRVVPYQGFNHMDFLTAIDAPTLIYNDIFEVLNNY